MTDAAIRTKVCYDEKSTNCLSSWLAVVISEGPKMHEPKGRLTDIFSLPTDGSGQPQSILMLDQLTHVPEVGDVLRVANRNLLIAHVDRQRMRSCLTGWPLIGRGSIAVLVSEPIEELKPLAKHPNRLWVTWRPKADLPWHFKTDDLPMFIRLNEDWNAHPNDVGLRLEKSGDELIARMKPNPYAYRQYENVPEIAVSFINCSNYRVTSVNDEGWYSGQCRFSGLAPKWGEFYEISGNTRDSMNSTPWIKVEGAGARHFHFYLKDETLEIKAQGWVIKSDS
ncbi:hypothetical protein K3757_08360 [Sulfitobacter sp. S223]|uniref:hypothetical protein n=1 Tax=Sulfitobacter sp. S223 TaxID=2867023 RepID=UPI0021A3933C|nr:hypothetical protein [Sulfitobacter sp. S223]UWR27935.1 hypothetical protein K3757_08360 [Sulfitobacter sp. S223]